MKKIIPSLFCAVVMCFSLIAFAGCGETKYSYAELQRDFETFVTENTFSADTDTGLFNENGYVEIKYANPKLVSAINNSANKQYMFTRLTNNLSSEQAVFEPALQASLLYVSKYISVKPASEIPTNVSTQLYNKFIELKSKASDLQNDIIKFNIRGDNFKADGAIEASFLNSLLQNYYQLIIIACDFSEKFIEVANQYILLDAPDNATGRVATGKIERFYLEKLTQNAISYSKGYLSTFYNQSLMQSGQEVYTSANTSKVLNDSLKLYYANQQNLEDFEKKYDSGEMNALEKNVVQSYKTAQDYQEIFDLGYASFKNSYQKVDNMIIDPNEEFDPNSNIQAHKQIVKQYLGNEYVNMANFANEILKKVSLL